MTSGTTFTAARRRSLRGRRRSLCRRIIRWPRCSGRRAVGSSLTLIRSTEARRWALRHALWSFWSSTPTTSSSICRASTRPARRVQVSAIMAASLASASTLPRGVPRCGGGRKRRAPCSVAARAAAARAAVARAARVESRAGPLIRRRPSLCAPPAAPCAPASWPSPPGTPPACGSPEVKYATCSCRQRAPPSLVGGSAHSLAAALILACGRSVCRLSRCRTRIGGALWAGAPREVGRRASPASRS
mmetsp:Transcript_25857/g.75642  ORF Transcript_25857/g.75642 Transcript_25857/m.75642 type:complete len:246 (-) Transcript_25857:1076-1813(-)